MSDRTTTRHLTPVVAVAAMTLLTPGSSLAQATVQPRVGTRSVPLLERAGLRFRDLNRSGTLDLFEDWRLTADARRATFPDAPREQGAMMHGTARSVGPWVLPSLATRTRRQSPIFDAAK